MPKHQITEKKRRHIEKTYDISLEYYNALREIQKFKCAVCKIPETEFSKPLVVDHDHKTGQVRGLLCLKCNMALGLLADSPKRMIRAAMYVYAKEELTSFSTYVTNLISRVSSTDILHLVGSRAR